MSEMVQTDSAKIMQEAEPPILGPQAVIPYYEEYEGLRKFYASFRFQHDLKYFRILSLRQPRFSNARYQIEYLIDKLTVQIRPKNRSANGDLARNYGKYASSVEKMLRSFEGVEEWTDLISALTRLNKVGLR